MDERQFKWVVGPAIALALAAMALATYFTLRAVRGAYDEAADATIEKFAADGLSTDAAILEELLRDELDAIAARAAFAAVDPALPTLVAKTLESPRNRADLGLWLRTALHALQIDIMTVIGPDGRTVARGTHWREFGDDVFVREVPVSGDPLEAPSNLRSRVQEALAGRATSAIEVLPAAVLGLERAIDRDEGVADADAGLAARAAPEARGLALITLQPVVGTSGEVIGAMVAGRLLNRDGRLLERFRRITGREAALFLYGRVVDATADGANPALVLGAVMPPGVREDVYRRERAWLGVTDDAGRRFYTAVRPLQDVAGAPVAAIAVSFLGDAIDALRAKQQARAGSTQWMYAGIWVGVGVVVTILATWLASLVAGSFHQRRRLQLSDVDRAPRAQAVSPPARRGAVPSARGAEPAPAPARVIAAEPPAAVADFHELNRRFDELLGRAAQSGDALACLLVGIDQFPLVAERAGAGAVRELYGVLRDVIARESRSEPLVGTFAEGQLLAVLPFLSPRDAFETAERIRRAAAVQRLDQAAPIDRVTVAIGLSVLTREEPSTKAELLLDAEEALQDARKAGGDTTVVRRRRRDVV